MDGWVDPGQPYRGRKSLYRARSTMRSASATSQPSSESWHPNIGEVRRSIASTLLYPFVDILLSDIMESEETLDTSELVRDPPSPSF